MNFMLNDILKGEVTRRGIQNAQIRLSLVSSRIKQESKYLVNISEKKYVLACMAINYNDNTSALIRRYYSFKKDGSIKESRWRVETNGPTAHTQLPPIGSKDLHFNELLPYTLRANRDIPLKPEIFTVSPT